ncbi:biotin-dependent carboxyltransferase family protein [Planococcus salinus]|uniref:Biotin-dependent carboxyltransferase family protein n=1 Tax=Planococcus salinus TaxID=1848460 RepID=A0A3M8P7L7_9BACL|nr:biotin-dependent carboxyltransferase family protein [Planococcus salinus]RNF39688.1 biotin-dependent carboxyltransferase family protein [Planococcus salinus]
MIKIHKAGLQTTVQDLGRRGFQKFGVIVSGAMDLLACRMANILVNNAENEAVLEIAITGPTMEFTEEAVIAICGADMSPSIDGHAVRMWRPLFVEKGSVLSFGPLRSGCRTYVAFSGGVGVPEVMNSKSTYLRAQIGGFHGRALQKSDELEIGIPSLKVKSSAAANWGVSSSFITDYSTEPEIRLLQGRQYELFTKASQKRLVTERFEVSTQSDRMGYRLSGQSLSLEEPAELLSEAIIFGSIQVPPDGNPIVLMADRQTTGGYPKIGQVASVDLPLLSQLKPGDGIRFKKTTLAEAQKAYLEREQLLQQIKMAIQLKYGGNGK